MNDFQPIQIISYKHNGNMHRTWLENWCASTQLLLPQHREQNILVVVNKNTRVLEADGKEWTSRIPAVTFFLPDQWFNVVALIEASGLRYYCNVASPVQWENKQTLSYIDYDIDVIRYTDGRIAVVDQQEFSQHQIQYDYPDDIVLKADESVAEIQRRMRNKLVPFEARAVYYYYEQWRTFCSEGRL